MEVTYESDLFTSYKQELDLCQDFHDVKFLVGKYSKVSPDLASAQMESPEDFKEFRKGIVNDSQGNPPGEEWLKKYASIAIPLYILRAQLIAYEFGVPWGVAYLQMCVAGIVPGVDPELAKQEIFSSEAGFVDK